MTKALVALDIGGTKTQIVAETADGNRLVDVRVPSTGWDAEPETAGARWIASTIRGAISTDIEATRVVFGAQGINNDAVGRNLEAGLLEYGFRAEAHNDADLIVPAGGFDAGIGLIAGTGSIAVSRDNQGNRLVVGGWGSVIGDEGGGAALVREAARAALRARDAGLPDDGLLEALIADFGVPDAERLTRRVNDVPTTDNWAPHAPAVFAAAEAGSRLADSVIRHGAAALANLVAQLAGRGAIGSDVIAAGSVIVNQQRLFDALKAEMIAMKIDLNVHLLTVPPVNGAVFLARKRLGWR